MNMVEAIHKASYSNLNVCRPVVWRGTGLAYSFSADRLSVNFFSANPAINGLPAVMPAPRLVSMEWEVVDAGEVAKELWGVKDGSSKA